MEGRDQLSNGITSSISRCTCSIQSFSDREEVLFPGSRALKCTIQCLRASIGEIDKQEELNATMDTTEVEMRVECECCGIYEDCTPAYIGSIKALYCGTWICGLCSEVVNEQMKRTPSATIEEAVKSHMSVCSKFNMAIRLNPQLILADSLRDIARKSSKYRTTTDLSASRIARSISL